MHNRVIGNGSPVSGQWQIQPIISKEKSRIIIIKRLLLKIFCNKQSYSQHCKAIFEPFIRHHRDFHGLQYLVQLNSL